MWDIERITAVARKYAKRYNEDNLSIPININSRLTKTLGRVRVTTNCYNEIVSLVNMEFSKNLFTEYSDEAIEQVIAHEVAHYLLDKYSRYHHGHDEFFKAMCAKIGCTFDQTQAKTKDKKVLEENHKYIIYCTNCDYKIGKARMCKTLKDIMFYVCPKCHSELKYKQNW